MDMSVNFSKNGGFSSSAKDDDSNSILDAIRNRLKASNGELASSQQQAQQPQQGGQLYNFQPQSSSQQNPELSQDQQQAQLYRMSQIQQQQQQQNGQQQIQNKLSSTQTQNSFVNESTWDDEEDEYEEEGLYNQSEEESDETDSEDEYEEESDTENQHLQSLYQSYQPQGSYNELESKQYDNANNIQISDEIASSVRNKIAQSLESISNGSSANLGGGLENLRQKASLISSQFASNGLTIDDLVIEAITQAANHECQQWFAQWGEQCVRDIMDGMDIASFIQQQVQQYVSHLMTNSNQQQLPNNSASRRQSSFMQQRVKEAV
jgi:hypothetical protein